MKPPTAKSLILDLLLAISPGELSARDAIASCALFDIRENNARVALVRLSSAGLIEGVGRGAYRLAPAARELADEVATWRSAEARLHPWRGAYVVVGTHTLVGGDRTALRKRTRALAMLGFRELARGTHVRPDNLEGSVDAVRARLFALGLPREALVFIGRGFGEAQERAMRSLWDGRALSRAYEQQTAALEAWRRRAHTLDTDVAARESFLLGGAAIKQVVLDPLLPGELVDEDARHAFFEAVARFDATGRVIWQRFFEGEPSALAHEGQLTH